MARAGKCPLCDKSRVLEKMRVFIDGKLYFVYICKDCLDKIKAKLVEPF